MDSQTSSIRQIWTVATRSSLYLDIDARIWIFTDAYSVSPGMLSQIPGKGAKYMLTFKDCDGEVLSGSSSYRLKLPANVPAANFWSVTLYDAENAAGLANRQPFPSLDSRDKLVQNSGSTELYCGPEPLAGNLANWLATVPGKASS